MKTKSEPITPLHLGEYADPVDAMRAAFAAALGSWRRLEGLVIVLTPGSAAVLTRAQARSMLPKRPRLNAEIAEALDAPEDGHVLLLATSREGRSLAAHVSAQSARDAIENERITCMACAPEGSALGKS